jgi:hypothetical protein
MTMILPHLARQIRKDSVRTEQLATLCSIPAAGAGTCLLAKSSTVLGTGGSTSGVQADHPLSSSVRSLERVAPYTLRSLMLTLSLALQLESTD